jgi:hypothetical protein
MRWSQRLHVKPPAAALDSFGLELGQESTTYALAVQLGPNGHEVDLEGAGKVRREGSCTQDIIAAA